MGSVAEPNHSSAPAPDIFFFVPAPGKSYRIFSLKSKIINKLVVSFTTGTPGSKIWLVALKFEYCILKGLVDKGTIGWTRAACFFQLRL